MGGIEFQFFFWVKKQVYTKTVQIENLHEHQAHSRRGKFGNMRLDLRHTGLGLFVKV